MKSCWWLRTANVSVKEFQPAFPSHMNPFTSCKTLFSNYINDLFALVSFEMRT